MERPLVGPWGPKGQNGETVLTLVASLLIKMFISSAIEGIRFSAHLDVKPPCLKWGKGMEV